MTDRELLSLAAKAAGINVVPWPTEDPVGVRDTATGHLWKPLDDDGDALRLAVKGKILRCHMDLFHWFYEDEIGNGSLSDIPDELRGRATRRAIVRAAAEIGKTKP